MAVAIFSSIFFAAHIAQAKHCADDTVFKLPPHTNEMLKDISLESRSISAKTAYVLIQITSKNLFDRTKTRISFAINDLIYFTTDRLQTQKNGQIVYHPALSWCPGFRYEELKVGGQYVFVVEVKDGNIQFDPIKQIYEWNDSVRNRFEQLRRADHAGRRGAVELAETLKQEIRNNPGGSIALFKLNASRLAKQDMRQVGYQAYVAADEIYAAQDVLTDDELTGANPPDSEDLFLATLLNLRMKPPHRARDLLKRFFSMRFKQDVLEKNGSPGDAPYWRMFVSSPGYKALYSNPTELSDFIKDWNRYRACGAPGDGRSPDASLAWEKRLSEFEFFTACNHEPSGTSIWFSSLPYGKTVEPKLRKILAKPYNIELESVDTRKQSSRLASFAVFPEGEDHETKRKRVIGYDVECTASACAYKTSCHLKTKASTLVLRLPINPDPRTSKMEHEFLRLVFGISNDFTRFKKILEMQHQEPGYINPYPSYEGYLQLIRDVKTACKL
ncbi:MAG: hypothetical protein RIQ81_2382 [Pseudomonadota bacterium]